MSDDAKREVDDADGLDGRELLAAAEGTLRVRRGSKVAREIVGDADVKPGQTKKVRLKVRRANPTCACGAPVGYRKRTCDDCKRSRRIENLRRDRAKHLERRREAVRACGKRRSAKKSQFPVKLCERRGCSRLIEKRTNRRYCDQCGPIVWAARDADRRELRRAMRDAEVPAVERRRLGHAKQWETRRRKKAEREAAKAKENAK